MKKWVVFRHKGKELCAYTYAETFAGEARNTRELLAAENNIKPEDIQVTIESRADKKKREEPER